MIIMIIIVIIIIIIIRKILLITIIIIMNQVMLANRRRAHQSCTWFSPFHRIRFHNRCAPDTKSDWNLQLKPPVQQRGAEK